MHPVHNAIWQAIGADDDLQADRHWHWMGGYELEGQTLVLSVQLDACKHFCQEFEMENMLMADPDGGTADDTE